MIDMDFAKAFDSVDHKILLAKLDAFGVSRDLLAWFSDNLTGQKADILSVSPSSLALTKG